MNVPLLFREAFVLKLTFVCISREAEFHPWEEKIPLRIFHQRLLKLNQMSTRILEVVWDVEEWGPVEVQSLLFEVEEPKVVSGGSARERKKKQLMVRLVNIAMNDLRSSFWTQNEEHGIHKRKSMLYNAVKEVNEE